MSVAGAPLAMGQTTAQWGESGKLRDQVLVISQGAVWRSGPLPA